MNNTTRGGYKDYISDNSLPLPRVTAWRNSDIKFENDDTSKTLRTKRQRCISEARCKLVDHISAYHNEALKEDCYTDVDPALAPCSDMNLGDADEEIHIDDEEQLNCAGILTSEDPTKVPLYSGASITLATSMLLIISFAMRHSLTGEALTDLLVLIELHCLTPNVCQKTMKMFTDYFKTIRTPLEFHHYCRKCHSYFGLLTPDLCPGCHQNPHDGSSYFIVIPLVQQLKAIFEDSTLLQQVINYKLNISKRTDTEIRDTVDGELYKEIFTRDGWFRGQSKRQDELHLSLQINTDGVSLFRSSNFSIWPVYFVINEFPPHLRFTRSNRIFGGLWFGYSKPDFRVFLKPFAEALKDLYHKGFKLKDKTVRVTLFSGVFDAPARCLVQDMVQFNGFYGCPFCLSPGETVQTSARGHTHAYPFNMNSATGHHDLRTHAQVVEHGRVAEEYKTNSTKKNEYGIKGLHWLHFLPNFDIVRGVAVDYMHCIMLGIMKMMLSLWFDKSYRAEPFSISNKVKEVNDKLLSIKPPNFASRLPRTLSDLAHYKASEFKMFMLFYSLPCLWGTLPEDLFQHYLLLVQATYVLLSDQITVEQLHMCKKMLMHFCINLAVLYGPRYMTSNVHMLLHLCDKVRDLGPLWSTSCFYFEDFNGQLRTLFHGTQKIETQIAFAVCVHQNLPKLSNCLSYGSSERDLYTKLMGKNTVTLKEKITADIYVLGGFTANELSADEHAAVLIKVGHCFTFNIFKRAHIRGEVIHSTSYRAVTRRNSTVVEYKTGYGETEYGVIRKFVKVFPSCQNQSVCQITCICKQPHYLAVINKCGNVNVQLSHDDLSGATVPHLIPVSPPIGQLVAVTLDYISALCVCVPISDTVLFLSKPPNKIEKE